MFLDCLRLIKSDPDAASQRIREPGEPCIFVVVGSAGFSRGIAGETERFCRCGRAMFDDSSHSLRDHPCDRRGHYLLMAGVRLVNYFTVYVVDPFDQVGLLPLTLCGKGRIGGCNIF